MADAAIITAMSLVVRDLARAVLDGEHQRVLVAGISLAVGPGRVVGMIGPSGSGKSTVLRVLAGLDPRSGGEILLDGAPLDARDEGPARDRLLLVPQDAPLPAGNPRETLRRIGGWRRNRGRGDLEAAAREGLELLGLDAGMMERPWSEFSGGERRRVWIAFAGSLPRGLVLLDEPTAGLDSVAARRVADWVKARAAAETGILIATHDEMLMARCADHVIVLFDGEVHAEGPPEAVIPQAVSEVAREDAS